MKNTDQKAGTVYLVGAGPGDPDLITVRGARLLKECDVVVYDNLIPDELIVTLPAVIERQYVGKKAGRHSLIQDEINQLLVSLALQGKNVVRLKGGDPVIFGCGGVEAQYLRDHGIKFEFVPGITAGVAAPTYAGILCTDRRKSSFVVFATGHKASDKEYSTVPWKQLAKAEKGTLVVYMAVSELPNIVAQLLEGGMSPETPAAVIERGTFPTQRVVESNLSSLYEATKQAGLKPPAILIIGEVIDLKATLEWYTQKPLFGLRILITRPADQAGWLYTTLRDLGAEVLPYPTIATEEENDAVAWDKLQTLDAADRWLVFTSENGVRYFMDQWRSRMGDIRGLAAYKVAAIGTGTARALKVHSIEADFIPTRATTIELARQMSKELKLDKATVVRVRGNLADDRVETALEQSGATVLPLPVYRTFTPAWADNLKEKLFTYPPDVIFFSSGSTVNGLAAILSEEELARLTSGVFVVSIGPSTSEIIRSHNLIVALEAEVHSIPAMIEELVQYHQNNPIRRSI